MKITNEVQEISKRFEEEYIELREGLTHNAHDTLRMCDFYSNSKYLDGNQDALGREKPFFNIVNFRVTLAKVATDLDIKDIRIEADKPEHWIKSFLLQKEAYEWMKKTNYGVSLNERGYARPKYGGVAVKKRMEKGELYIDTVKFKNFVFDQVDFEDGVKIEKHFMTPVEMLRKENSWENVREAIEDTADARKKNDDVEEQFTVDRIEVWEVHGQFPKSYYLEATGKEWEEEDEWVYSRQVYFLCPELDDMILFVDEEKEDPYKFLPWETVEGRSLGRGVIEEAEEAQVWVNDLTINEKNAMDLASRVMLKTNAPNLSENVLEADNGKIWELNEGEDISKLELTPASLGHIQNIIERWGNAVDKNTSTYDANTGEQPPSGTPYSQTALLNQVASRPFDYRREEWGLFEEEIWTDWVIPHLIKKLKKEHILVSDFNAEELELIDESFGNKMSKEYVKQELLNGRLPSIEDVETLRDGAVESVKQTGEKRFIKVPDGFFDDIDAQVSVITTGEHKNKTAVLTSLSGLLQTVASSYDPNTQSFSILENDTLRQIFGTIMEVAGTPISPVSLMGKSTRQAAPVDTQGIEKVAPEPTLNQPAV